MDRGKPFRQMHEEFKKHPLEYHQRQSDAAKQSGGGERLKKMHEDLKAKLGEEEYCKFQGDLARKTDKQKEIGWHLTRFGFKCDCGSNKCNKTVWKKPSSVKVNKTGYFFANWEHWKYYKKRHPSRKIRAKEGWKLKIKKLKEMG